MVGSDFLTYVKRYFKRTDKDTEIYEAITDTIVDIRLQLKTEDSKEEAYVTGITTLGDYRLPLPTDFGHIIGEITLVDDSSGYTRTLNKISKQRYDEKYGDRLHASLSHVDDAMPEDFCIYAEQIYLGYVPDKLTYRYYLNYTTELTTAVTAATDPVPFSEKYRSMLRAGTLADLYAGLEFFDEANYWKGLYNEGLMKLKANDDDNTSDKGAVVYHGV
jgi:hypothetical protein